MVSLSESLFNSNDRQLELDRLQSMFDTVKMNNESIFRIVCESFEKKDEMFRQWVFSMIGNFQSVNERVVRRAFEVWHSLFQLSKMKFENDREIVLAAVRQDGLALEYAGDELRNDREIVLVAVLENEGAFQYVDNELRKDREFFLALVRQDGLTLRNASVELRNDREIVLEAVLENESAFLFVSDELRKDREFFLKLVRKNGLVLRYAGDGFKKDREIVFEAVRQNAEAFQYALGKPTEDPEIRILASQEALVLDGSQIRVHSLILQHQPEKVIELLALYCHKTPTPAGVFLKDDLSQAPGEDAGGLRNTLLSDLFMNLLDNAEWRNIRMQEGVPVLSSENPPNEEVQSLAHLGVMLARCYRTPELITGRMLPDGFFRLVQQLLILSDPFESKIIELVEPIASEETKKLFPRHFRNSPMTVESKEMYMEACVLGFFPSDKELFLRLAGIFRLRILAARIVAQGMQEELSTEQYDQLQQEDFVSVSQKIQGNPWDRQEIANRIQVADIQMNQWAKIEISNKVKWLKEKILDPQTPIEWVKNLLCAVTGCCAVTAETKIRVCSTDHLRDMTGTCGRIFAISDFYIDARTPTDQRKDMTEQQKFYNYLQRLIDSAQAGIHLSEPLEKSCFEDRLQEKIRCEIQT